MNSGTNTNLEQAQQGTARLHKIDSMLKQLKIEQISLGRRRAELERILAKESEDVDKLEHTSLSSLLYSVLGRLEEKVDKERQEALAAKLKYDQTQKGLTDIQDHIDELSAERTKYLHCPQEFEELYARKKAELMRDNGKTALIILQLEHTQNQAKINLREINEATAVGEEAWGCLNAAEQSLDKAGGWGTLDLFGGGLISDLAKHANIDDAQGDIENAQLLLRRFKTELADINMDADIVMETGGFAKFADFFFDGLIADWFMQSKIRQSQDSLSDVKNGVESILQKLRQYKEKENALIKQLEAEISEKIIEA